MESNKNKVKHAKKQKKTVVRSNWEQGARRKDEEKTKSLFQRQSLSQRKKTSCIEYKLGKEIRTAVRRI